MKLAEAFTVTPYDKSRTFKQIVHKSTPKGLVAEEVMSTGGFLVMFPNGNSIRVESKERLAAMGLDVNGGLVDLDSGEAVPIGPDGKVDFRAMIASSKSHNLSEDRQLELLGDEGEET